MNDLGLFYIGTAILLLVIVVMALPTMVHGPRKSSRSSK